MGSNGEPTGDVPLTAAVPRHATAPSRLRHSGTPGNGSSSASLLGRTVSAPDGGPLGRACTQLQQQLDARPQPHHLHHSASPPVDAASQPGTSDRAHQPEATAPPAAAHHRHHHHHRATASPPAAAAAAAADGQCLPAKLAPHLRRVHHAHHHERGVHSSSSGQSTTAAAHLSSPPSGAAAVAADLQLTQLLEQRHAPAAPPAATAHCGRTAAPAAAPALPALHSGRCDCRARHECVACGPRQSLQEGQGNTGGTLLGAHTSGRADGSDSATPSAEGGSGGGGSGSDDGGGNNSNGDNSGNDRVHLPPAARADAVSRQQSPSFEPAARLGLGHSRKRPLEGPAPSRRGDGGSSGDDEGSNGEGKAGSNEQQGSEEDKVNEPQGSGNHSLSNQVDLQLHQLLHRSSHQHHAHQHQHHYARQEQQQEQPQQHPHHHHHHHARHQQEEQQQQEAQPHHHHHHHQHSRQQQLQQLQEQRQQLEQQNQQQDSQQPHGSGAAGGAGAAKRVKRLVWTSELHRSFMSAVHHLGVNNCMPKNILQRMGVEGMTRENVASHLQKYRQTLRKIAGVAPDAPLPADVLELVQQHAMRMSTSADGHSAQHCSMSPSDTAMPQQPLQQQPPQQQQQQPQMADPTSQALLVAAVAAAAASRQQQQQQLVFHQAQMALRQQQHTTAMLQQAAMMQQATAAAAPAAHFMAMAPSQPFDMSAYPTYLQGGAIIADINNAISSAAGRSMDAISRQMSLCSAAVQQHFNTYSLQGGAPIAAQHAALTAMHQQLQAGIMPTFPASPAVCAAEASPASPPPFPAFASGGGGGGSSNLSTDSATGRDSGGGGAAVLALCAPEACLLGSPALSPRLAPAALAPAQSGSGIHHLSLLHQQQHYVHLGLAPAAAALMAAAAAGGPNGASGLSPQQQLSAMATHAAHLYACRLPTGLPAASSMLMQQYAQQQQQQQQACMGYSQFRQ